ncbi:MAG: serine hydrolase domain-containing protein [Anaerolineae bacterium]
MDLRRDANILDIKGELDGIVDSLATHRKGTGLIVGVVKGDQRAIFGYGRASDARAEPPGEDTLFEIGSITKVFTATLLSILVADGLLSFDDPVRDLVPGLSNLSPELTLIRLAIHTSGLPKMPSNIGRSMRQNRRNPFAAYTTADLFEYLSNYKPKQNRKSTERVYYYSNLGPALLGHILAQATGTSYERVIVSRICDKLDLPDTRITLTPEQQERLATPHKANSKPGHNWDLPAFAGAGALRSTANDLLKWLAANLERPQSALTDGLQICHKIHSGAFPPPGYLRRLVSRLYLRKRDISHYEQSMALGWHVGRLSPGGKQVYWRHGATGGYQAFAGFVKDTSTGVVVLANRGLRTLDMLVNLSPADRLGFRVLEHLNSMGFDAKPNLSLAKSQRGFAPHATCCSVKQCSVKTPWIAKARACSEAGALGSRSAARCGRNDRRSLQGKPTVLRLGSGQASAFFAWRHRSWWRKRGGGRFGL